jgi:hypothetical protein
MRIQHISHPIAATAALAVAALFAVAPAVHATTLKVCASDGRCGQAQPVGVANVAGKFTIAGEVVGMNLTMASSWQAANGQNLEGKATLSVALPNSGNPQANYTTEATVTDPQNGSPGPISGTGSVTGGAGLRTVTGVSQAVQVAGDGNGASNLAQVEVVSGPIGMTSGNTPSAIATGANGAEARVNVTNNGVNLQLTVPNAGMAQQQVNAENSGNIYQNIQIAADRQQVANQLQLQLQVQPLTTAAMAADGVSQALNMLRGR